ncbi:clathrin interactor EPSIN 2-like [Punica granatum]|uniref:Clathrin interactor EPSIN 2-like n=1 Tax=Punica granatum TaxID=22663 RepID=A0A6P8EDR4_PUNGR|nr:clathrin interactor EPSIN 2-like [Punica granatum]
MKKAFDQTVRDLKREVNKKVLKVPGVEQKVLDATSNEPWGPHGSLLADIAQASRNYHEYQMIMNVIWKRINDTGKNWRHVYKALTVLEYMVANGSERVIDEIREHAYQIQTLNSFQYIDSSGKDQGNNVRKKSQSLVVLVSDKERIAEVRQKAAANRDKFRSMSSSGGMYRPGSYSDFGGYSGNRYDDYRGRDDDRSYDYGKDRDGGYYRDGDSYSRDGDRYGRDSEDRYGRDSYRESESRGRSRSTDDYHYGSRSRSSDQYRDRDRNFDDDGQYSSRGVGKAESADDSSRGERKLDRKFSEQNLGAPPSYEEAVSESRSPSLNEREGENSAAPAPAPAPRPPVSPVSNNMAPPVSTAPPATTTPPAASSPSSSMQDFGAGDEFDPRVPVSAAPSTSKTAEEDIFGSLSDSFSSNPLAIMPVTPLTTTSEVDQPSYAGAGPTFASLPTAASSQGIDDPFGDSPFKAVSSTDNIPAQPQPAPTPSFPYNTNQVTEQPQMGVPKTDTAADFGFGSSISGLTYSPPEARTVIPYHAAPAFTPQAPPPSSAPAENPNPIMYGGFAYQTVPNFPQGSATQMNHQVPNYGVHNTSQFPQTDSQIPQTGLMASQSNVSSSPGPLALVPQQPNKDKFETKSTVWADTLSRGLVNLNISGSKTNPLADIGVDFDALNRKEKRMEKTSANPPISTVTMGKAMGSGTGMGRAGASAIRPPTNPMGSNMGMMNMGGGMGPGMGMGGYRGMGQPVGQPMGMGMGMGMNTNMGTGMNAGMMQRPGGAPSGQAMPGAYNPMMGSGNYTQQPYGGGYR